MPISFVFYLLQKEFQTVLLLFIIYINISRWQTLIGAVLLLLSGKLGWVEMSRISR